MLLHLCAYVAFATSAYAASADDWSKRSIYQLVTDRFATPDGSSPPCDTSNRTFCGGTWQGVINKLDYITNMGFDAIWISPITENVQGVTAYGEAFHGYWPSDIFSLNSHMGSADDLNALSSALHAKGMYLMVDVVVNHLVPPKNPPDYSTLQPFSSPSQYHQEIFITDYNNQTEVEQEWLGDTNLPLADLNTEDQDIVNTMYSWINGLVGNYSVDGLRIDTAKHIRKDFWPDFVSSAGVFTIAEVLEGDTNYVSPYTQVLDSVLDYPTYYPLFSGFTNTTGNLSAIASTVQAAQASYKNGEFMTGAFVENHDQPRIQSVTKDQALVANAVTWPFIQDSIPILYYGQEQGYTGGADPANREALWLSGYVEDKPLVNQVKALNAARKAAMSSNSDFLTTPVKFLSSSPSSLAVSKPPLLTLLSNGGSSSTPSWSVPNAGFGSNEKLVDVLTCSQLSADGNGGVSVTGSGGMPQVIMPASSLSESGNLCQNLAAGNTGFNLQKPAMLLTSGLILSLTLML